MSACIRKCNGGRKRLSLNERYVVLGKTFESVCLYVADPATFLGTVFSSENSLFIQLWKKMNILFVFLHTAPFNWKEKISFLPSSFSTFLPSPSIICITISLPPLLHLPPFPSFLSWRGSPRTHGVLVGSVLPRKTSDSCSVCICVCVCLCVCVRLSWSRPICWPSPAGRPRIMSYKPLLKLDLFTLPLARGDNKNSVTPSVAGPTARPWEKPRRTRASQLGVGI